jgi:hypothetical protein
MPCGLVLSGESHFRILLIGPTSASTLRSCWLPELTIYWKIWVTGGEIEFSSGSLLIEAFGTSNASLVGAAVEPQVSVFQSETTVEEPLCTQRLEDNNPEITVFN